MEIIDFDKKLKNKKNKTNKNNAVEQLLLDKAVTLSEALPYIKSFAGEIFVIKFGGNAMGDPNIVREFAKDVVLLKKIGINPVIVHGGGPQIGAMLSKLKIKSKFIDGLRVTDKETVDIVEMVLSGLINKDLVAAINQEGGLAIGLSGKDANLIKAKKIRRTKKDENSNIEKILDLGFVGEPVAINPEIFLALDESDVIPVIAPIGIGEEGETYNINADTVAGKIAESVNACKLIMLTDVDGLLDKKNNLLSKVNISEINNLIKKKVISGGMIPKINTALSAVENGVLSAHILNGTIAHILLVEVFTENGAGTMIVEN
ncbi:MAG: acetylglutamate kinase [Rickettsiales bacterium]|nr:acetylglutamate kinase [Rickettsiales bacterium]